MDENIFETIRVNAERAAEKAQQEADDARARAAAIQADRKRAFAEKRKNATRGFLIRAIVAAVLCGALWLANATGLMATGLAICLTCADLMWLSFFSGAWVQFMWCKGDLLK